MQRARLFAVLQFEVRAQLREPLTTLYLLVFGLLSFGYAASNSVELVSSRGAIPRTASWSLMLAFGGLTAFGQVITTMIATTAMLRDEAQRTRELVATSGVSARTWFVGRVAAASCIMLLVYAAMPLGILLGSLVSGVDGLFIVGIIEVLRNAVRAYAIVTIPTMLVVTLLLASAAAYTQRVLGVLAAALALVGLWQLALALVVLPDYALVGALLDPFGNAPVLANTSNWSVAQRTTDTVPFGGVILLNRLLWMILALSVAAFVAYARSSRFLGAHARQQDTPSEVRVSRALAGARSASESVRHFTAGWMQLDGGWRIVSVLAVCNAVVNAAVRPVPVGDNDAASILLLVSTHARIFLILLATVYAGELVWRERDVRVDQLIGATPVSRSALVRGRVAGLLLAQRQIMLPLVLSALVMVVLRTQRINVLSVSAWMAWSIFVLWLPFAQLTVLSLAVHVLLNHKVLAHLLLITGWVAAVSMEQTQTVTAWWLRYADAAPLMRGDVVNWPSLLQRGAYWSAVSAALLLFCWWRWPHGGTTTGSAEPPVVTSQR